MKLFETRRTTFQDPLAAGADGLVDVSDDLRVERLLEAYSFGIFPWPHEGYPTLWFYPFERGILDFSNFHKPKSLQKDLRRQSWTYSFDRSFIEVIHACARARELTWITPKMLSAYESFHRAGYAHSLEVWEGSELVGGLYGVYVGGVFSAESMFFKKTNASKAALCKLVEYLSQEGVEWIDIQMVTPLLKSFGGETVDRLDYWKRLQLAKASARALSFKI